MKEKKLYRHQLRLSVAAREVLCGVCERNVYQDLEVAEGNFSTKHPQECVCFSLEAHLTAGT